MKLITVNTWMGNLTPQLMDFLRKYQDTEIFCFQEVYHDATEKEKEDLPGNRNLNLLSDIRNALPDHQGYFRPSHKDFYGQAIFIRNGIDVKEEGDVQIFNNPGTDPAMGTHSRNLQFAVIADKEKAFAIANVHGLWNGQGKSDTPERILQSQNIKHFLDNRSEAKILCGDFNLLPDTESIKIAGQGLRNLIKDYGITSTRTSYYDKGPEVSRFADYVFVSEDVTVENFKVLPDEVSDHAPIFLEFN